MDESDLSFGSLFRSMREHAGRQLSDVAAELHINIAHLQALEDEAFDRLPSHSFARGYIRAYARALEADPEPLLKAYRHSAPSTEEWHASRPLDEETRPSRLPLVLGTAAVAATVVALFVIWFLGSGYLDKGPGVADEEVEAVGEAGNVEPMITVDEQPLRQDEQAIAPVDPSDSEGEPAATDDENREQPVTDDNDSRAEETKNATADDIAAKQEAPEQQDPVENDKPAQSESSRVKPSKGNPDLIRAPQGSDKVEITLNDDSWVDIKDANGQRLLRGLYLKGASKTLVGKAPFQVFLGNAPAVTLKAAGKPVDIAGFVRPNKTARFAVLQKLEN